MALYHWHHMLDNPKLNDFFMPYLGPEYKDEEVLDLLKGYDYEPVTVENLTEVLCNRDVVCVARGRS